MRVYESVLDIQGILKGRYRFSAESDDEALRIHERNEEESCTGFLPGVESKLFDVTTSTPREVLIQ